jgi:hypothetical protein
MVRLYFQNWNSLGVFTQKWKLDKLNALIQQAQIDLVAGCKTQVDWWFAPPEKQFSHILAPDQAKKMIESNNTTGRPIT